MVSLKSSSGTSIISETLRCAASMISSKPGRGTNMTLSYKLGCAAEIVFLKSGSGGPMASL